VGGDSDEPELVLGNLGINLASRRVTVGSKEVHLTPNEYRLLAVLARNAGKVITQRQLLKEVWGPSSVEQGHYLRVYMAQLRHKLETEPARPRWLITEPGVGYRLRTE
jgi:two-component system KDP operon response regulator KdpE